MPGRITSLLDPSRNALHLQSTKRTAALNEIARQLEGHPDVANFSAFYDELLARDRLDTTCLGNAVALPHARTEHVKKIVMAVGRADTGIPFDTNGEIVRLFFVLGTPKTKPGDYLAVVSALDNLIKGGAGQASAGGASGGLGGLGGLLGGLLGGGGSSSAGAPGGLGGLAAMLDADGNGNPLDDILRGLGRS